jgi:hypothetical protein
VVMSDEGIGVVMLDESIGVANRVDISDEGIEAVMSVH